MRKTVLHLLFMAATAAAVAQQAPPQFPPGATLEEKKEIIRQRMIAAQRQAMQAQRSAINARQQAAENAAKSPETKAREKAMDAQFNADMKRLLPLIREWIKAEQGTEEFKIGRVSLHGGTRNEKYRGAEETAVSYECKGLQYFRQFYIRDGKVIDVEVKTSM